MSSTFRGESEGDDGKAADPASSGDAAQQHPVDGLEAVPHRISELDEVLQPTQHLIGGPLHPGEPAAHRREIVSAERALVWAVGVHGEAAGHQPRVADPPGPLRQEEHWLAEDCDRARPQQAPEVGQSQVTVKVVDHVVADDRVESPCGQPVLINPKECGA